MKKPERLKSGPNEFDDDLNFDYEDFDFGEPSKKDRKPAGPLKQGVKNALKDHYTSESTIRKLVGKALPKEYGTAYDTYASSRDKLKDAFQDFENTTREPINEFAKAVRDKIPTNMQRTRKFVDFMEERTRSYKAEKINKEAEQNKAISASLEQLFAAQDDARQNERDQDKARSDVEKTAELIRFKSQTDIFNSIARSTDIVAKHTIGITQAYQKKSLELQYRMVFGIKDTNDQLRLLIAQNKAQLESIRHNTGLPETEKIRMGERFKNTLKNKFVGKTLGSFSAGGDNIFAAATNQFSKSLKEIGEYVGMGLQAAATGMSMDFNLDDEDPVTRRKRQIAEGVTKFGLHHFDNFIGNKAQRAMRGNRKVSRAVRKGASNIKNILENGDAELRAFALGGEFDEGVGKSILRGLASMLVPGRDKDNKLSKDVGTESLKEPAILDNAYKRSITQVMPGYLARILQELQIARTGDAKVGLTYFDHNKGSFVSKGDLLKKYNEDLKTDKKSSKALDAFINDVTGTTGTLGGKRNQHMRNRLKTTLLKARMNGASLTPERMGDEGFWKSGGSSQDAAQLARAFKKYFDNKEEGKFSGTGKAIRARAKFIDQMKEAQSGLKDPRALIQSAYDQGHGEIFDELGFTKPGSSYGSSEIDLDKIIDNALGNDKYVKSDFFAKDNIKPVKPETVLQKLKKIVVSKWKYKPGESEDQEPKLGPMAQDVNKQFGEDVAPGGKKIDLASMNGINMAGIQGLQDRIDKELGDSKGMSNLEKLVYIAERSYGVLSMIAEKAHFGGGVDLSGGGSGKNSFFDKVKGYGQDWASKAKENTKGIWESSLHENAVRFGQGVARRYQQAKKGLTFLGRKGKAAADKGVEEASKLRLFGARKYQDLKDGIPVWGDLYIGTEAIPRLTKAAMQAGNYFDIDGNPLTTLLAIADAVKGVFDKDGQMLVSPSELLKSYVKSDKKIFARVFMDRVQRAAKALGKGAKDLFDISGRVARFTQKKLGVVGKFGMGVVKELLMPPRDVYVVGEATPRLLAHVMRLKGYFNKVDNSIIERPTQIKSEVVNSAGETLISEADLVKGLVDANGQPFVNITQRIAAGIRKRAQNAVQMGVLVGKAAKGAAKGVKTFVTKGLSGFRSNGGEGSSDVTVTGGMNTSILEQIRDILDARLPNQQGGSFFQNKEVPDNNNDNVPTMNVPASTSSYSGGPNLFSAAAGTITSGIGSAAKMVGGLLKKGKRAIGGPGALGMLGSVLGGDNSDNSGVKEAVEDSQKQTHKEIDDLKKENKSLFRRMVDGAATKARAGKKRIMGMVPAMGGKSVAGDTDGDGLRDNSWQDLKNKQRNVNEHHNTLADVKKPEDMGTENTIDLMMKAMGKVKDGIGSFLGDLFGGGGPGGGKGGRAPKGKGGWLRRGAGKAMDMGKGLFSRVAGAGARLGTMSRIGSVAMQAGKFGLTRLAIPALAGVAGILGSPVVATALTIGGAVWGLKSLYDLVTDKKKDDVARKTDGNLQAFRMAEYGVGMQDTGPTAKLLWLEEYLYPHVKVDDGKASINEDKIDAQEIVTRFGLDLDDEDQLAKFSRWLERRFKPNFLKHAAAAKTCDLKSMADIDKMKPSNKLAFYKSVSSMAEGYDEMSNPFGSANDLVIGSDAIKDLKSTLGKLLEDQASKSAKDEKTAEEVSAGDLKRKEVTAIMGSVMDQANGGIAAANKTMDGVRDMQREHNKLNAYRDDKTKDLVGFGEGVSYATNTIVPLPSKSVSALTSIRYRLYGLVTLEQTKTASLNALEAHAQKFINVESNGVAKFSGAAAQIFDFVRSLFGVSAGDTKAAADWTTWFQNRFLPVFTNYYAQACFHTGAKDLVTAAANLTPAQSEAVANAMMALSSQVVKVVNSPWPGYVLSQSLTDVKPFADLLKERAEKQTLDEEKVKQPVSTDRPTVAPSSGMMQTVYRPPSNTPSGTKPTTTQSVVLPDTEQDAQSVGSGESKTPVDKPNTKVPGTSSLKSADGELMNGAGADDFLRLYKGATLDGANPEAAKLFRGMVEEYGTLTGKKIQLNAGKRSYADQAREYATNRSNAAPPGSSLHEFGLAFDINSSDADALEKMGLMRKYGFTRPVGGEPWHIEPAGIQDNVNKYKKDGQAAMMAVSYSPGKGGGGVGMAKGLYAHGRRNTEHALSLFNASGQTVSNSEEQSPSRSAITPTMTNRGGYAGSAQQIGGEVASSQALPDFEGSANVKSGSESRSSTQAALNNFEGKGGGYQDLPGTGSGSVSDMKQLVKAAAEQVGVDPNLAQTTVAVESSFKGSAAAGTSSAKGLYQFTKGTWNEMVQKHGASYGIPTDASPTDPKANAIMGALYLKQNLQKAQSSGMPPNALSAYLMHFLGPNGGKRFMGLGEGVVPAHAMAEAAAANKAIFFDGGRPRSKQEIMALLQNKLNKAASAFGIGAPDVGNTTQVAKANTPAANDATSASSPDTEVSSSAPTLQNALYKPEKEAPPKPVMVAAPSFTPLSVQPAMQRDMRDTQVGSMGTQDKILVDGINNTNRILGQQLGIQQQILEILLQKKEESAQAATPASEERPSTIPNTPKPDRSPRKVSEPVIDTRRWA